MSGFTLINGNSPALLSNGSFNNTAYMIQLLEQHGESPSLIAGDNASQLGSLVEYISSTALSSPNPVGDAGVYLSNVDNCTVEGNIIANCTYGIIMSSSANNTFKDNSFSKHGIRINRA